ncbi:hypothetical protein K504DRAFT_501836 [Pleomassaria siparia CBS 279.74]|uniref:Zn(2)-C6 fungal-type domain-containing protein n=1 Tax=Pleomassaria siparia CBS 279.74 TaxID=1314801 RepID=A0A6G1KCN5_9PLEO|nr:hypothetical protein K504DRAFT_501836 [Pleomassaria siparia CBS 279.74]
MQGQKESRSVISCTECQRRKQKCSREWPCNHCQARKVPHLCQFVQKRTGVQQESPSDHANDFRGKKRSLPDSPEGSFLVGDNSQDAFDDGLKAWGYMPGHVHYNLGYADTEYVKQSDTTPEASQQVDKILHVFPSRSVTDRIVNYFLGTVNYRYNSIYAPTFTDQYVQWWSHRFHRKALSPEFTCLLLRVCAHSGQHLPASLCSEVEFELACTLQVLTDRFAAAAEELSASFGTTKTSLERVQEQFLKAAWLKSESKMIEAWHVLGRAIREAQELGIHKCHDSESLTEFEVEMRCRIWTLLYLWDWQMSAWLGRPHQIDQTDLSFPFPTLRLEDSATEPNLLSPFAHMSLQAQLARRITQTQYKGNTTSPEHLSVDQVITECETFIDELPPIFRMESPDLSFDDQHPYFVVQRRQLHVVIFVTMFDFLKPHLTRRPSKSSRDVEVRNKGIEVGLKILKAARSLFDHEFLANAKFHLVAFSVFDTATVLSSAMIHDSENLLPHREQVMVSIESALDILRQLSFTKIGASSYLFLFKLVEATPVLSRWFHNRKRPRTEMSTPTTESNNSTSSQVESSPPIPQHSYRELEPVYNIPFNDGLSFDMENFFAQYSFKEATQPDIGGLEQIWDWDTLNLDAFLNNDSNFDPSL